MEKYNRNIKTFDELLRQCAKEGGTQTAFSYKISKKVTAEKSFSSLYDDVVKLSVSLDKMGFAGEHIAIIGENRIEWIETFFAVCRVGSVAVLLDKDCSSDELEQFLQRSNCKAAFYSDSYKKKIDVLKESMPNIGFISFGSVGELIKSSDAGHQINCNKNENDVSLIVFTSGTTGISKGVMLSQKNILSNALAAFDRLYDELESCNKILMLLPLHHTFGLVTGAIVPLMKLGHAYICDSLRRVTKDIQAQKPDLLFVVPVIAETIYKKILSEIQSQGKLNSFNRGVKINNFLKRFNIDLSRKLFADIHSTFGGNLKSIICGGAPIGKEYIQGFCDIGIEFLNGYGITECSPIVSVNGFGKNNKIGSVGAPLCCNGVRIKDPDTDGIGMVEVRGSNVMLGYLNDEKSTKEVMDGEWFITGDCGKFDKDGFLYLTGREKNLIILSNGKNVSPEEIETKLLFNNLIEEVVVSDQNGKITAEIYPNQNSFSGNEKDIYKVIDEYNKTVPPYKNIEKIIIRSKEFSKTSTMKIKRQK